MSPSEMAEFLRVQWRASREQIANARRSKEWRDKRPDDWFPSQEARLHKLAEVGAELAFIAKHEAAYRAWKSSINGETGQ